MGCLKFSGAFTDNSVGGCGDLDPPREIDYDRKSISSLAQIAMSRHETRRQTGRQTRLTDRPIVLVGMMGAGKTSIGRRLATRLGIKFLDADQEIEAAAGMTIPDIFQEHGEAAFREGERKVIARLLSNSEPIVLATGGGAFLDEDTRVLIKAEAVSIWLNTEFNVLMERVRRRNNRPLLKTDDPEATMRKLLAERTPVYAQADIAVETGDGPHQSVVTKIEYALASNYEALRRPHTVSPIKREAQS